MHQTASLCVRAGAYSFPSKPFYPDSICKNVLIVKGKRQRAEALPFSRTASLRTWLPPGGGAVTQSVTEGDRSQVLRTWGTLFPTPFLLTAPKETVSDRQRKALYHASVRPSIDRRRKSGHPKHRFPLPLMRSRVTLLAAHGRAPGAETCWKQACPVGLAEFYNCQQSGSGK